MMNPTDLETVYHEYMSNLKQFAPDGIVEVDLSLLQELDLLSSPGLEEKNDPLMSYSFHVVESSEKLTLFNEKFVVWIVPMMGDNAPLTLTLMALNEKNTVHLEMIFSTRGVYNHSSLVLKILEKFLHQIEENEQEMCKITRVLGKDPQ